MDTVATIQDITMVTGMAFTMVIMPVVEAITTTTASTITPTMATAALLPG
jgi:hypothetical protein